MELSIPKQQSLVHAPGLEVYRVRPFATFCRHGTERRFRTTRLVRTLIDLAGTLSPPALELALDSAHRRHRQLVTWLRDEVVDVPRHGVPGVGVLRELVELRCHGFTDSALEVKVVQRLRATKLPMPVARLEITDRAGYVIRLDLAWPLFKLALHIDGYRWHDSRARFERDANQRSRLAARGWRSIIVTWAQLQSDEWIDIIADALGMKP